MYENILCPAAGYGQKYSKNFIEMILNLILQLFIAVGYPEERGQLFLQLCFPMSTKKGLKPALS